MEKLESIYSEWAVGIKMTGTELYYLTKLLDQIDEFQRTKDSGFTTPFYENIKKALIDRRDQLEEVGSFTEEDYQKAIKETSKALDILTKENIWEEP